MLSGPAVFCCQWQNPHREAYGAGLRDRISKTSLTICNGQLASADVSHDLAPKRHSPHLSHGHGRGYRLVYIGQSFRVVESIMTSFHPNRAENPMHFEFRDWVLWGGQNHEAKACPTHSRHWTNSVIHLACSMGGCWQALRGRQGIHHLL